MYRRLLCSLLLVTTAATFAAGSDRPAGTPSVARGPYLQQGTADSVIVRWRTDLPTDSVVRYGLTPAALASQESVAGEATDHEVALSGLSPETRYYYAVGSSAADLAGGTADHAFRTAPLRGEARPTRIWVLGDSGTGTAAARRVRDAYLGFAGSRPTDLWLMLGDNAYPDGTDLDYQLRLFDMYPSVLRQVVLWPTLGNHDGVSADSATQSGPYYDIFTLPTAGQAGGVASGTEAYYAFDYGNLHFVVLDSHESDRSPDGAMLRWLELDLATRDADWTIAFWHHPPYSKGSHDSDLEGALVEMRERVLPILDDHGVDLTLCGHSHSYERSFLIDGAYETPTPDRGTLLAAGRMRDGGDGRARGDGPYRKPEQGPAERGGIVHTVAGSSGQITGGSLDHPVMAVSHNVLGSLVIDVEGARLDATFLDDLGAVRDRWTMIKGPCRGRIAAHDGDCDGVDDDCDRAVDEDFRPGTTTCGVGACRSTGQSSCLAGRLGSSCVPLPPSPEVCDGVDNDCDGRTDEGCDRDLPAGETPRGSIAEARPHRPR